MKHVTWRRLVLAGGLAATAGGGCSRPDAHHQASLQPPAQAIIDPCRKWRFDDPPQPNKWRFNDPPQPKKSPNSGREECTPDQCGLNGMWFGQGVPFRELHLNLKSEANAQGLKLVGVIPPHPLGAGKKPVLAIRLTQGHPNHDASPGVGTVSGLPAVGDELFLKDEQSGKTLLDGTDLEGTTLLLELKSAYTKQVSTISISLKIVHVLERTFWDCNAGSESSDCKVFHYEFIAHTDADGGCDIQICAPELAQGPNNAEQSIQGTAVVFAGDVYDDKTFKIKSVSANPKCPEDVPAAIDADIVNFACTGTVVSKLHLMRHTAASARSTKSTTVSQRQAMLRMLTADYCGIGYPFTHDGVPIQFRAMGWPDFQGYKLDTNQPLEAVWTDRGVSCLGTPRWATNDEIAAKCKPQRCLGWEPDMKLLTPPPPSNELTCSDASGNYLMSANPHPKRP